MIYKQLRQHQRKSFRRNPMFERNMAVKIFMGIMFGFLAIEMFGFGLVLDKLLLQAGQYERAISVFNSLLPYLLTGDFLIKFFFKNNRSMQIAPYLTLPVKRNTLFNYLLSKEFTSIWNFYLFFLVLPFAFKAILPFYGIGVVLLYIVVFWLMCIAVSLLVSSINLLLSRSLMTYLLAFAISACPYVLLFVCKIELGDYTFRFGEMLLNINPLSYSILLLIVAALWVLNRIMMRAGLYRELQGDKVETISSFSSLSFLDRFGVVGYFINLELKMLMRSPRLKQQLFSCPLFIGLFVYLLYSSNDLFTREDMKIVFFLYSVLAIGLFGITMGQYIFIAESAHFDGLAARPRSLKDLLRSKYIVYCAYSLLVTLIFLVPTFQGKLNAFMLIATLLYVTGPIYFLIFQTAVYNKTFFDLFDKGMMNWKGLSGNMLVISMLTMFLPVGMIMIINVIWGEIPTYWFMSIVGLSFVLTSKYWLSWIYSRFLKRRYKNMEGLRSSG
ncbi:MAG: DUF5687 family protein [Tannerella sp.]|jgi:hypothetical protein|nr:DUF5687 family protein [Tannerella sp.]